MKKHIKRISILLTMLLILSSFPIMDASAKVSDNTRYSMVKITGELPTTESSSTTSPTTSPTQPSTENARDSLYNTYQRIKDSIPVGGTPYTKESQQRFNAALRAAEDLLGDATATDSQLRDAESELIAAFNALERSTANRDNLWAAIETLRPYIESGEYKNFSNADEIKEIYDYALPVAYYEPEQSVIDEWEAKIYAALKKAGVITEPTTYSSEPTGTVPTSFPTEPTTDTSATYVTEPTNDNTIPTYVTEPTDPNMTAPTEDPTGHCTDNEEMFRQIFATELAVYSQELGYKAPLSVEDVEFFYRDSARLAVFALRDKWCTVSEETIGNYKFTNPSFFGNEKNKTGLCVYYNNRIMSIAKAVQEGYVTAEFLARVIPHTTYVGTGETTAATQPYDYYGEMVKAIKARHADEGVESYHINIMTLKPLSNGTQLVRYSISIFAYTEEIHVEQFGGWTYETANPAAEIYDGENFYSLTEAYEKGLINDNIILDEIANTISNVYIDVPVVTNTTDPTTTSTEPVTVTNSTETTPTQPATDNISKAKVAAVGNKTYTGKAITPTVKVTYNGKILLKNKDYTLSYKNNKNVGTASIIITGKDSYTGTKTVTFKIVKAANTMTVKTTAKTVKYSKLKNEKQTVSAITVKKAIGKVSYKKTSGKSFFTVNSKTGKITIKKGAAKGTYTVKVKVTAAGNSNYKSVPKTVTVKITIK